MANVELKAVHKRYGDVHVVKGIDLHVADGEFLVLVGPSGCGKSTTLRMIAGLESVTEGTIHMDGRRVDTLPPKDRDIGMVFQSYALYPHMTVRQNLAFGLKLRKTDKSLIADRVHEAARMLGIDALLDRRPKALSGGQRQRVAMGRAIVRRPTAFLFDEPLSNLDAALRVKMRAELAALHRRLGTTMVYVTHDQVEAMTLANRIAVLERGVLQQVGPALELYHRPANRFVAGFIGSPAMNIVDGSLRDGKFTLGGVTLLAPEAWAANRDEGSCGIGIRPHSLTLAEPGEGTVDGVVSVVEPMGWEAMVHVDPPAASGIGPLVVQVTGATSLPAAGETVAVSIDLKHAHLFAASGGETLHSPDPA